MKFSDYFCNNLNQIEYSILIGAGAITFAILLKTFDYLDKLKNCKCYNDLSFFSKYSVNIELLKSQLRNV